MTRTQKADVIGWVIAFIVISTLVATFLTTPGSTPDAQAQSHRSDTVACDGHTFTRYIGMGRSPVLARAEITMHACWRRSNGEVIPRKSSLNVRFYNTGWGDTQGATFNEMEKWRPGNTTYNATYQTKYRETRAEHVGLRQCVNVLGQRVCGPTADFSLGVIFTSPYLSKPSSHSDGSPDRWDFVWFIGEPDQKPGSFDDNVYLCNDVHCS